MDLQPVERGTGAFQHVGAALRQTETDLRDGEPDIAAATATRALDLANRSNAPRCVTMIRDLEPELSRYAHTAPPDEASPPTRPPIPAYELGAEGWWKPWSRGNGGSCVEAKDLNDGRVAIRQSTDRDGPGLIYIHHEIPTFIMGAKAGDVDFLLG